MTGIRMVHPDLPGQPITVLDPVASVIYERSGWRLENVSDQPEWHQPSAPVPDGYVAVVHPASGQSVDVPSESVATLRASGWMLQSEMDENAREAAAAAARVKPASDGKSKAAKPAAAEED